MTKHDAAHDDQENQKGPSLANRQAKMVLIKKENKKITKKSGRAKTMKTSTAITSEPLLMNGPSSHESDVQARIAERAYELYRQRGGHHGQDLEDWLTAEREMLPTHCCS